MPSFGLQAAPKVMRMRAVLIGLALVILQTAITPYNDYYLQGTDISGNHFPLGAVFTLIFLTFVINPILKKVFPRVVLSPADSLWASPSGRQLL
ncbi:MAG: hypothetical protein OXI24_19040, partial [Candidatus Poribacteria bacterium]|nr:hypothetical protein [Candidatus Poribacteria bacterium]